MIILFQLFQPIFIKNLQNRTDTLILTVFFNKKFFAFRNLAWEISQKKHSRPLAVPIRTNSVPLISSSPAQPGSKNKVAVFWHFCPFGLRSGGRGDIFFNKFTQNYDSRLSNFSRLEISDLQNTKIFACGALYCIQPCISLKSARKYGMVLVGIMLLVRIGKNLRPTMLLMLFYHYSWIDNHVC